MNLTELIDHVDSVHIQSIDAIQSIRRYCDMLSRQINTWTPRPMPTNYRSNTR
jgi:hypothetical protein